MEVTVQFVTFFATNFTPARAWWNLRDTVPPLDVALLHALWVNKMSGWAVAWSGTVWLNVMFFAF